MAKIILRENFKCKHYKNKDRLQFNEQASTKEVRKRSAKGNRLLNVFIAVCIFKNKNLLFVTVL